MSESRARLLSRESSAAALVCRFLSDLVPRGRARPASVRPRARRQRALPMLLAGLLVLLFVLPAAAGSDANGDDPQLEAPIQQGIALRRAGNDEAALALFLELERSNPDSIRVLLHITTAAQATGRWLMAYAYFRKANTHKNEPYFVRYRSAIKNIEDAIGQHVAQFRAVGSPAGAEVRLNGEVVGTLPMTEFKPIELGQYALEVTKLGFYPLRRTVSVTAGGALNQEAVELRQVVTSADSVGLAGGDARSPVDRRREAERSQPWWHARWVTWTLAGATVATGVTSAVALVYRNDRADRWNSTGCLDATRTRQEVCGGVRDTISRAETIAVGSGIAAGVFGALTLTQVIVSTGRQPVAAARAPSVSCGAGLGAIACSGSF